MIEYKAPIGTRFTENKLRWRNFPLFLIRPLIEVGAAGEAKYGTYNFLKGQSVRNCMDSILRHFDSFEDPEQDDADSEMKVSHLAAIAWNALVAAYMIKTRPELDDRYKGEEKENCELLENASKNEYILATKELMNEAVKKMVKNIEEENE